MKFINSTSLRLLVLLGVVLVSGCASIDSVFSPSEENTSEQKSSEIVTSEQSATADGQPEVVLDPMQQKLLSLRAQPNLYLSGQSPVSGSSAALFKQALQAKHKNPDIAQKLLLTLTQTQPGLSGPWVQLGDIDMQAFAALKVNQWDQKQALLKDAKSNYQKAVAVNQHNYFAHNRLARVFRELGEFEQAEQHYQYAIASWPAYDNSYLNLGILYDLYMGKKQQALPNYELYQALQDKPVRQVRGWIADLKRQLAKVQRSASTGASK